ncbi:MAG TPA: 3'-5' exonuclease [Opitutaceae bacterium]|nr:3'-5' exonuclease [Opitutaceae bacterium]
MEQPVFFVDFEGSLASGVLEYGVATLLGGRVTATATRLCAPTGRVRPEDTEIHGLGEDSLAGCARFSADWEVFAGLRERGPLAAHYAGAENSLLRAIWPYPRVSPDFARPGSRAADWGPWIDSGRIYAQLYPDLESGRLESLVEACGLRADLDAHASAHCPVGRRRYHAALYDAIAGALLLGSLSRHPQLASLTVMQLLALSTLDPRRRDSIVQRELF